MSLSQRLYLVSTAGIGLMIIVFYILFWSWHSLNIAMAKVDYTQRVGDIVNQLQLHIFAKQGALLHQKSDEWVADQQRFTDIIDSAPTLSAQQQTLHNSIMSQNGSLIILFKQIENLSDKAIHNKVEAHLNTRLLTQIELIREDCLQLAASAESALRGTILKLFYMLSIILSLTVFGFMVGVINVSRTFKASIKDIQNGMTDILDGNYKQIKLSKKSTEFSQFVEEFNAMSKQLAETTVSRASLQAIVEDRTAALRHISNTDPLTNIANRRALYERGEMEFTRTKRHKFKLALLMIDCDFFKKINDSLGHSAGDQVLQQLCRSFENEIREIDFLARYGGEEFVILLPHCDEEGAIESAKRLLSALQNHPLQVDNVSLAVTVSIGIAINSDKYQTFEALLNDADNALFVAKKNGRNRFEVANRRLDEQTD